MDVHVKVWENMQFCKIEPFLGQEDLHNLCKISVYKLAKFIKKIIAKIVAIYALFFG